MRKTGNTPAPADQGARSTATFDYALRIVVAPGFHEDDTVRRIVEFCSEARVEEVILFTNCEELNTGHLTAAEQQTWMQTLCTAREALVSAGLRVSLNPWETLLHADRGRTLKPGQNFSPMVDANGRKATAVACPVCPAWLGNLCALYATFAELKPRVIWLEDDFRFHNHAPLVWGGCFCDEHLRLISEAYGRPVARQELVEAIAAPGAPHPLRRLWLDLNGRTMADNARRVREAVHRVSPDTRVGLMTSVPSVHCAEGRDWDRMAENLGGVAAAVFRPHLPAYSEVTPSQYLWNSTIPRQTAALLPEGIELLPEIDNGPHSLYSKSLSLTRFQMLLSGVLGSTGLTFNIFDMIGNGPLLQEGYQQTLAGVKRFLNSVRGLGLALRRQDGIVVPFSPTSSYTLDTSPTMASGASGYDLSKTAASAMDRLYPDESKWASLLSAFGLATRVTTEPYHRGQIVAISGQWLRNLAREEVRRLFEENAILLDGAAALTLYELGLGHLAGIRSLRKIVPVNSEDVSYEAVADGTVLSGCEAARFSAQVSCGSAVIFDYAPDAHVVTELKSFHGATAGPGMAVYHRRCLVLPFVFPDAPNSCLLHTLRRELIVGILRDLDNAPRRVSTVEGGAYLALHRFDQDESTVLLVANASTDDVSSVSLSLGGLEDGSREAEIIPSDGAATRVTLAFARGRCTLPFGLRAMDVAAVRISSTSSPLADTCALNRSDD